MLTKAKEPFRFYTRLHLTELTGLRASNLSQLLNLLKTVPDSCIYHHTHRFLQQHHYLLPTPANDFAYWISQILGEYALGEILSSIDIMEFSTIEKLREEIVKIVEDYLKDNPLAKLKFAADQTAFHFMKSVSFIIPTNFVVSDLAELKEALTKVTLDSIYFHIFESRLRLERLSNDFSSWIELSLGDKVLADKISRLDPYTYTLEDLRASLISILEDAIEG